VSGANGSGFQHVDYSVSETRPNQRMDEIYDPLS
jgi:hypothetical protein